MHRYDPAKDAYAMIGAHPDASQEEIEEAYRRSALTWHPDKSAAPDASERFQEILAAARILRKPRARKLYDIARAEWRQSRGFSAKPPKPKRTRHAPPVTGQPLPPPPDWLAPVLKVHVDSIRMELQPQPRAGYLANVCTVLAVAACLGALVASSGLQYFGLALVLFAISRVLRTPPHDGIMSWARITPGRREAQYHLLDQRAARYERYSIPYQLLRIRVAARGQKFRIEIAGFPRAAIPVLFETPSKAEARRLAREAGDYLSIPVAT